MTRIPIRRAGRPAGHLIQITETTPMATTATFPDIADFPAPRAINGLPAPEHVGWLEITHAYTATNTFETASWYEKVAVEPQIVPIFRCRDGSNRFYSAGLTGILTDSHFVNRLFQYSSVRDDSDKLGKPATAQGTSWDQFELYRETLLGRDGRRVHLIADAEELFPDYVREHVDSSCKHCRRHHTAGDPSTYCVPARAEHEGAERQLTALAAAMATTR